MSRKKLIKSHRRDFTDWLDGLTTEQLKQVRVKYGISTPKFTAVLEVKKQPGSEEKSNSGSGGIQRD